MYRSVLLFFILSAPVFAQTIPELAHPFHLLTKGQVELNLETGFFREEHEYEKAKIVQDLFKYRHYYSKIGSVVGLPDTRQVGLQIAFTENGRLTKQYSPSTSLSNDNLTYHGFQYFDFFFQEHLKTRDQKTKMAIELRIKGSPLKGKETNNTSQGKDISLSFLYSYDHKNWRAFGRLRSEVLGRKKIQKYDGHLEIINAYSSFGNLLGVQWLHDKFWLEASGHFALTTDYNSQSANYNRMSDKGFGIGGELLVGLYTSPTTTITLKHARSSLNFNIITAVFAENTEFEIEKEETQLGVTWLF